jgi:hypothetical protein
MAPKQIGAKLRERAEEGARCVTLYVLDDGASHQVGEVFSD